MFSDIKKSANLKNIESILDTFTWPVNGDCSVFGNDAIQKVCEHFKELFVKNSCDITKVASEWLTLKTQVVPIIKTKAKVISRASKIRHTLVSMHLPCT